ncbi:MAG TPA: hypothetical protein VNB64_08295 [Solirubrobacteraceae bacterium]|nr:hypothetical protein [Solirubrobacteraceae bacterium]
MAPWLPLVLAAVWLVALAVDFRDVVQAIFANSDFASAPVIGELYDERDGGPVVLGNFPWYSTLWFEQLTAGLPAHRQIWQVGPWLFALLGVGAAAWATWRAAGAWAAMIVAVALGCAGPALLNFQFGLSLHSPAYTHVCLLGAFLVLCAEHGGRVGNRAVHVALCGALAAVTAVGLASDELLLPAGIAPFLLAAAALVRLLPPPAGRRIVVSAVAIAAFAAVGSRILVDVMEDAGVVAAPFDVVFAQWDRLVPNLRLLAHSLAFMFNGDFGGARIGLRSVVELASAVAVLAAVVAVVRHARRWIPAVAATVDEDPREAARRAHVAFWLAAGAVLAATFVLSSVPVDKYTARYVLSVGYAVVVLVAVAAAAHPTSRAVVAAGVSLVVAGGVAGLVRGDLQDQVIASGDLSGPLERLARAEGVEHGYAGYWTAAPVTWQTRTRLRLYPVRTCTGSPTLCPYPFHRIDNWYKPRSGEGSLLVVDPRQTQAGAPTGPDPAFGPPRRTVRVDHATVYVYGYDIASRLGR